LVRRFGSLLASEVPLVASDQGEGAFIYFVQDESLLVQRTRAQLFLAKPSFTISGVQATIIGHSPLAVRSTKRTSDSLSIQE
jgi:hypothetical protein